MLTFDDELAALERQVRRVAGRVIETVFDEAVEAGGRVRDQLEASAHLAGAVVCQRVSTAFGRAGERFVRGAQRRTRR